jgi:hypothetical protein
LEQGTKGEEMSDHPNFLKVQKCMEEGLKRQAIAKRLRVKVCVIDYWLSYIRKRKEGREPLKLHNEHCNRAQWEPFRKYWSENPFLFKHTFGMENTPENMKSAWKEATRLLHQVKNSPNVLINQIPDDPRDDDTLYYSFGYDRAARR